MISHAGTGTDSDDQKTCPPTSREGLSIAHPKHLQTTSPACRNHAALINIYEFLDIVYHVH